MQVHIHGHHYGDVVETKNVLTGPANPRPGTEKQVNETAGNDPTDPTCTTAAALPPELEGTEARALLERIVRRGWLDDRWQPLGLSGTQRAILAYNLAGALRVEAVWKTFGRLWGDSPEALRKYYTRGMNQSRTGDFLKEMGDAINIDK